MLNIRYFASLREIMECSEEQIPWQPDWQTLEDVKDYLNHNDTRWQTIIDNHIIVMVAINQTMATNASPISDGDELAFFPPVTGG